MRREYRKLIRPEGLVSFAVRHLETDLHISAERDLHDIARARVRELRKGLDGYIREHPAFLESLTPLDASEDAPESVRVMCEAGKAAGVGPMAAVAGAFAGLVGRALVERSREVIVENGGDVFVATAHERVAAVHAGESPLSGKLGIRLSPGDSPLGVCTSSATVGHSLSLGRADAATVLAPSCALADAAATALGNRVKGKEDIEAALEWVANVEGVTGAAVILGDAFGARGKVELVELGGEQLRRRGT